MMINKLKYVYSCNLFHDFYSGWLFNKYSLSYILWWRLWYCFIWIERGMGWNLFLRMGFPRWLIDWHFITVGVEFEDEFFSWIPSQVHLGGDSSCSLTWSSYGKIFWNGYWFFQSCTIFINLYRSYVPSMRVIDIDLDNFYIFPFQLLLENYLW